MAHYDPVIMSLMMLSKPRGSTVWEAVPLCVRRTAYSNASLLGENHELNHSLFMKLIHNLLSEERPDLYLERSAVVCPAYVSQ